MKRSLKAFMVVIIIVLSAMLCGKTYARYVVTRHYETTFSSSPFYFEATLEKTTYKYNETGIDISINIMNFVEDFYNSFDTEYEIFLEENDKFELNKSVTGTIKGNSKETLQESITIQPKADADITNEQINIVIKSTEPYVKEITLTITIKRSDGLYLFMENLADGKTDEKIDFSNPNLDNGVFLNYETRNEEYPVYYYRGDVQNNAIYANYCWKIVRTTKLGGIKLIYNGEVNNGQCISEHEYLGSEAFNYKISEDGQEYASPHQVGYMYEKTSPIKMIVPSNLNDKDGILTVGTIFGHNISYDENTKMYTLVDTKTIDDLDQAEDDIRGGSYSIGYHYTCLTHTNTCESVYYIYYDDYGNSKDSNATGLFGIQLHDGLNVTQALDEMLYNSSNTEDSHAKAYLDQFFLGQGDDFKRSKGEALYEHLDELDDVPWCNDRTIAGYHGWDISADNHQSDNKYLHFTAFGRLIGDNGVADRSRPDITCDSNNDAFTVDPANGNGALDYPIGMLTADEAVLAGAIYDVPTENYLNMKASRYQLFMTPYYISDDHVRMFALNTNKELSSRYAADDTGIRPAIALNSKALIAAGDGSTANPYQITFPN